MLNDNAGQERDAAQRGEFTIPPSPANGVPPVLITTNEGVANVKDTPQKADPPPGDAVKFGSAENDIAARVTADISECDRINGVEDLFGSTESRVREKFKSTYKVFRHANSDPAYCAELAKQLFNESSGNYAPSAKKPWCLAAFLALKPKTEAHSKQTYEAAYFFRHAAIDDVSFEAFSIWIEGRNLKESIAYVRGRKKSAREPKAEPYPNIAKAKS